MITPDPNKESIESKYKEINDRFARMSEIIAESRTMSRAQKEHSYKHVENMWRRALRDAESRYRSNADES